MTALLQTALQRIFSDFRLTLRYADESEETLSPTVSETENGTVFDYTSSSAERCRLTARDFEGTIILSCDIKTKRELGEFRCAELRWNNQTPSRRMAIYHKDPFWTSVSFPKQGEGYGAETQHILMEIGNLHFAVTMLCGDIFHAYAHDDALDLDIRTTGYYELHGPMFALSASTDPMSAVRANYENARACGAIAVPLARERQVPPFMEYFGYCTWNTFYQKVTSAGIYEKLAEFKEKNIPVKWMIIDDGWEQFPDNKLFCMEEDKEKFPEGLKACIRRIKEEYGVEYVGVWHTFNAYWGGIHQQGPLAEKYADCLMTTKNGTLLPDLETGKGERFWDDWYAYLEDCGVDFVKVDSQSHITEYMVHTYPNTQAARNGHAILERAAKRHFRGWILNCMGMDLDNALNRPESAVSRNSQDFMPEQEDGFSSHLTQNVYSSCWQSMLYCCDFDMWWSGGNADAIRSGVLRALSGGPVYVSDALGGTERSNILPVCGKDGNCCRMDFGALPTSDSIYLDCRKDALIQKVYNRKGDGFALGLFNLAKEERTAVFDLDVIPELSHEIEYVAYEYFSQKYTRVNFSTEMSVTLPKDGVACYSLYPIIHPNPDSEKGAYILRGDTDRYFSVASPEKTPVTLKSLSL